MVLTIKNGVIDNASLLLEAKKIILTAYSPYSNLKVAAVLLDDKNRLFQGVNVENASYGLTVCAERNALFSSVTQGASKLIKMLVIGYDFNGQIVETLSPCGACRQVIGELMTPEAEVLYYYEGELVSRKVSHLLPDAFSLKKNN